MPVTQADLDALDLRIVTARKRVESGDKAITEYDISQLIQARNHVARELVTAAGAAPRNMRSIAVFRRR